MSGKNLDAYSDGERSAYEQGAADTHERYEAMHAAASLDLAPGEQHELLNGLPLDHETERARLARVAADVKRHAYAQGITDGETRGERALTAARERLAAAIEVVAHIEQHQPVHTYARRVIARQLRDALALGSVKLKCSCEECVS